MGLSLGGVASRKSSLVPQVQPTEALMSPTALLANLALQPRHRNPVKPLNPENPCNREQRPRRPPTPLSTGVWVLVKGFSLSYQNRDL